jgi:hypothetical protein
MSSFDPGCPSSILSTDVFGMQQTQGQLLPPQTYFGGQHQPSGAIEFRQGLKTLLKGTDTLTLVLSNVCDQPCTGDLRSYTASYWAGTDELNYTLLLTTHTTHDVHNLPSLIPIFNLWWLDPVSNHYPGVPPDIQDQRMEVLWFYWHASTLDFPTIHLQGQDCDSHGLVGTKLTGGCMAAQ